MTMIGSVPAEKLLGMQIDLNTKLRSGAITVEEFEEFLKRPKPFAASTSETEPEVAEPTAEMPLLELVTTVGVGAVKRFDISDHYRKDNPYGVKVTFVSDNFNRVFGGKTEKDVAAARLKAYRLTRGARDPEIIENLGEGHKTFLAQLWSLVKKQPNGESGVLLTNGYANILEVPNPDNPAELWAVFARWRVGWKFYADSIDYPYVWVAGFQVFSR